MDIVRIIMIFGAIMAIFIPLHLNLKNLLKFYDKKFSFSILREGATYDNLYDNFNDIVTNEGKILNMGISLIFISIPLLFAFESNYFLNLGIYLIFAFPAIMLLCRIRTFGDSNILPGTGLGYDPMESWRLSLLSCMWGFMIGFSSLNFISWEYLDIPLITISLAVISGMIPIFPDYINKLVSYEIRSKKGLWTLRIICVVSIVIQLVVNEFLLSIQGL